MDGVSTRPFSGPGLRQGPPWLEFRYDPFRGGGPVKDQSGLSSGSRRPLSGPVPRRSTDMFEPRFHTPPFGTGTPLKDRQSLRLDRPRGAGAPSRTETEFRDAPLRGPSLSSTDVV